MYQACKFCVMDTSDPTIRFKPDGSCDHCENFNSAILSDWNFGQKKDSELEKLADTIRRNGKGRDFDCIIGLSGGLDSSYAAYVAKEKMGLRPLLFHVDAGWNTDQAVSNIEKLVDGLGLDLFTDVVNWEAVKRMQVAFLRSGISDQDLVQDAAFFSGLYRFARQHDVKHVITGSNFSTECCREPEAWGGYLGIDKTYTSTSILLLCIPVCFVFQWLRGSQKVLQSFVHQHQCSEPMSMYTTSSVTPSCHSSTRVKM